MSSSAEYWSTRWYHGGCFVGHSMERATRMLSLRSKCASIRKLSLQADDADDGVDGGTAQDVLDVLKEEMEHKVRR